MSLPTHLQHGGSEYRVGRGLVSAVETSVTFVPDEPGGMPVYARLSNTKNHLEVCALLAGTEGAEAASVFASGMAAMTAFCFSFLKPGDHIVCQENCYGGNFGMFSKVLKHWGVDATFAPIEQWQTCFRANTRAVYFESISNPFCIPQDVKRAVELSKQHQCLSLCDNTFASPFNFRPLEHGVDVVLESGTKYLNGHSDVVCGVLASTKINIDKIAETAMYLGGFLPTAMCAALARGMRTFAVRMAAHNTNGAQFSSRMRASKYVQDVYYGTTAEGIFNLFPSGFGGMCTVRFKSSVDVVRMLPLLRYIADVPSLGGTETTVCLPIFTTNRWMNAAECKQLGIDEKLVRFSIGLENVDDIISDISHALASL